MGDGVREHPRSLLEAARLVDSLGLAVVATLPDGTIVSWNRAAEELYGYDAADTLGRAILDVLVPSALADRATDIFAGVLDGTSWDGDFVVVRADGSLLPVHVIDAPIVDDDGTVLGVVGVGRDITEDVRIQQALRESSDALRLSLTAGRLGTWRWDIATGATIWDEQLEALFGLAPGSFDGTFEHYRALLHPDDRDEVLARVQHAVDTKSDYDVEHRVVWPDGSVHWLQGRGSVTLDARGEVVGTGGCVGDVTESVHRAKQTAELTEGLQAGLLPRLPDPPGIEVRSRYAPGEQRLLLGGDFLDVATTPAGHAAFCIGDVAGHGPVSAAVGTSLRAGWRALALTSDDPVAWLAGCARLLASSEPPPELFVTLTTGYVSSDRRTVVLLSAGHPAPILLTGAGVTTLPLTSQPPLGLLEQVGAVETIELPDAWTLLMFTDGLFEGLSEPGGADRLGSDAIETWCRARDCVGVDDGALDDLLAFAITANGGPLADDVAVLALSSGG